MKETICPKCGRDIYTEENFKDTHFECCGVEYSGVPKDAEKLVMRDEDK